MAQQGSLILSVILLTACAGDMPPARGDGGGNGDKRVVLMDQGGGGEGAVVDGPGVLADQGGLVPDVKPGSPDLPWPKPDTQPATDDVGKACTSNADCMYNICATNTHTGVKFCTKVCDPCAATPCPSGSGCQNAGLAYICAPSYPNAPCTP